MRFSRLLALITFVVMLAPLPALAGPIYVFTEADGTVRFTSRPPPRGVTAKVFTAKSNRFSYYKGNGTSFFYPAALRGSSLANRTALIPIIELTARRHSVDPALVKAVIHAESAFNTFARSPKGAQGLMQLMPDTARMLGVTKPYTPEDNIGGGVRYLAQLLRNYQGNVTLALAAYNAGPEAVRKHGGIPPYPETRQYVTRVLSLKSRYSTVS